MNTTYLAITIGPIFKTFGEAKRTRAVWAASYFFSWFSRRIVEEAMRREMNVLLPYTNQSQSKENWEGEKGKFGAGLYADRIYFIKDDKTNLERLKEIVDIIIDEICEKLNELGVGNAKLNKSFLKDYLNIHFVEKEINSDSLKESDYPLKILNGILDNKELFENANFNYGKNPLQELFKSKTDVNNFLAADAFSDNNENKRIFKSIPEIATAGFGRDNKHSSAYRNAVINELRSKEDTDLIDELIKGGIPIMPHHKYFAVIYADGDNIGKLLTEISKKGDEELKEFSKTLFEFGMKAEITIDAYGGSPIYLGGEDILAFVPLTCLDAENPDKQKTVFELIKNLDEDFKNTVQTFAKDKMNDDSLPTLSFGVAIAYYKHPLKEVMREAHDMLDDVAKNEIGKNAVSVSFMKHSGHAMRFTIQKKHKKSVDGFYELIDKYCETPKAASEENSSEKDETEEILASIIQHFRDRDFRMLYSLAFKEKTLESFYENFFNEDIHKEKLKNNFLKEVRNWSNTVLTEYEDNDKALDFISGGLRLIHFINSTKDS